MPATTRSNRGRPLGLVENIYRVGNELNGWILTRVVHLDGPLDDETLRRAACDALARFDALRVRIVTPWLRRPRFEVQEEHSEPPLEFVERDSDERWRDVCYEVSHQSFAAHSQALWRVVFVRKTGSRRSELVITMHHALADGMTLNTLVRFLLERSSEILRGDAKPIYERQLLMPPVDELMPRSALSRTLRFLHAQVRSVFFPPVHFLAESGPGRSVPREERRALLTTRSFDQQFSNKLRAQCRQQHTTVFGAFHAAMWTAAWRFAGSNPQMLSSRTPFNLRDRCQPAIPVDQLGCYVWYVDTTHRISAECRFWDLARECRQATLQAIEKYGQPPPVALRHPVALAIRRTILGRKLGRMTTTSVSNLGALDFPVDYGRLRVREMYSMSAQHLIGSTAAIWVAGLAGQIFSTCSFVEPPMDGQRAEEFTDLVVESLQLAVARDDLRLDEVPWKLKPNSQSSRQ